MSGTFSYLFLKDEPPLSDDLFFVPSEFFLEEEYPYSLSSTLRIASFIFLVTIFSSLCSLYHSD